MWTYHIPTGDLISSGGEVVGTGYSGAPGFINDPSAISLPDRGPIPPGLYAIGTPVAHDPKLGDYVMALTPDPSNVMYRRADFYLHGDNPAADHSASEGCVVLPHPVRVRVGTSDDHWLQVVLTIS